MGSLIDVALERAAPRGHLLWLEPESYLTRRIIEIGRAVNDVPPDVNAEVPAYRAGSRLGRLRDPHHGAGYAHHIGALPDHGADGAAGQELAEPGEERPGGVLLVVLLDKVLRRHKELHGDQLEAPALEAGDYLADEAALDTVRLHHEKGAFTCHF
eukprot:XP_001706094.1 Hypothetical protein GL50803_29485 [Giardia lamblia ATCC 50803]